MTGREQDDEPTVAPETDDSTTSDKLWEQHEALERRWESLEVERRNQLRRQNPTKVAEITAQQKQIESDLADLADRGWELKEQERYDAAEAQWLA